MQQKIVLSKERGHCRGDSRHEHMQLLSEKIILPVQLFSKTLYNFRWRSQLCARWHGNIQSAFFIFLSNPCLRMETTLHLKEDSGMLSWWVTEQDKSQGENKNDSDTFDWSYHEKMIWHTTIEKSLQRFKDVTEDKQNNDSDIFSFIL